MYLVLEEGSAETFDWLEGRATVNLKFKSIYYKANGEAKSCWCTDGVRHFIEYVLP